MLVYSDQNVLPGSLTLGGGKMILCHSYRIIQQGQMQVQPVLSVDRLLSAIDVFSVYLHVIVYNI